MAGSSLSSEDCGIHLTSDYDYILLKISHYFTNIDRVNALAIQLFLGSPTGGEAVVAQLEKDSSIENKALKVLHAWRKQYYTKAYGRHLYEVLNMPDVNPMAAEACKLQLCPLNPAKESQAATTSSPQAKQPCKVTAVWKSSSGRFAVFLDEEISSQLPDFNLSSPLTDFFKELLGNFGHVSFLREFEGQPAETLQLICVSVAVKLDDDLTAAQLDLKLTGPLAGYIGLPASHLKCHKIMPSKFGSVKCVYSLPMKKANSLFEKWEDVQRKQELQEIFSDLPALIALSRPISSITDTIDENLWGINTRPINPPQPMSTSSSSNTPTVEKRLSADSSGPQETGLTPHRRKHSATDSEDYEPPRKRITEVVTSAMASQTTTKLEATGTPESRTSRGTTSGISSQSIIKCEETGPSKMHTIKAEGERPLSCLLELNANLLKKKNYDEIERSFGAQFSVRFGMPEPKVKILPFSGDPKECILPQVARLTISNVCLSDLDEETARGRLKQTLAVVLSIKAEDIDIFFFEGNSVAVLFILPVADLTELLNIWQANPDIIEKHMRDVFGGRSSVTVLSTVFGSTGWPFIESIPHSMESLSALQPVGPLKESVESLLPCVGSFQSVKSSAPTGMQIQDQGTRFQVAGDTLDTEKKIQPPHLIRPDLPTHMADPVPLLSPGSGTAEHPEGSVNAGTKVTGQMSSELHEPQVTAVRPMVPTNERGVRLVPDHPLLYFVGLELKTERQLSDLAVILLKGQEPDGKAFVDKLPSANCIWRKSRDVLKEWVVKKPEEAFGSTLFSILKDILGNPKAELKQRLLSSESTHTR